MKTITVMISPQGDARIEATGFKGGECRMATAKLRAELGQDSSEQLKPEYAMQPQAASASLQSSRAPLGK